MGARGISAATRIIKREKLIQTSLEQRNYWKSTKTGILTQAREPNKNNVDINKSFWIKKSILKKSLYLIYSLCFIITCEKFAANKFILFSSLYRNYETYG